MTDLSQTVLAKSNQLNADDLLGRTLTIKITGVDVNVKSEQPVTIHYEGEGGRPYLPCKTMRRVMMDVWGPDGRDYIGRRMTLYRDDKVQFGGLAVGGIRISHMSHLDQKRTIVLMVTKAKKAPYVVQPLAPEAERQATPAESITAILDSLEADLKAAETREQCEVIKEEFNVSAALQKLRNGHRNRLVMMLAAVDERFPVPEFENAPLGDTEEV